jgi:hypothetical protein
MVLRSPERTWIDMTLEYVKSGLLFSLIVVIISAILEAIATRGRHNRE